MTCAAKCNGHFSVLISVTCHHLCDMINPLEVLSSLPSGIWCSPVFLPPSLPGLSPSFTCPFLLFALTLMLEGPVLGLFPHLHGLPWWSHLVPWPSVPSVCWWILHPQFQPSLPCPPTPQIPMWDNLLLSSFTYMYNIYLRINTPKSEFLISPLPPTWICSVHSLLPR